MKTIFKFATLTLMMFVVSVCGFSASKAENLERGIVGPVSSNVSWSGYSVVEQIPGAGLIPVTSTTTVFYLGFTAGTEADISGMVLYTTPRGGTTISAVTPVKLGGVSNPSIDLASTSVCPVAEISAFNPCIVRLDPTTITLSALNDYYLVVYFTASDSNDETLGVTAPSWGQTSLRGTYISGNETQLSVGGSIPSTLSFTNQPYLLMYVMTD
ncbi:MAG TPA: hypothetical protein VN946_12155 [Terriglobales bacterium]|jgi:hypothetical protein|nr:hypothetical protein [Terriglobales bacterium]